MPNSEIDVIDYSDLSFMRTPAAATYLGLSPRTLEKWRTQGRGPKYARLGNAVVYRKEDLQAFFEDQAVA